MACMRTLGFTDEEIDHIWEILAAILSLGNVEYKFDEDKNEVSIEEHLHDSVRRAAELIKLSEPEKMFTMLQKKVVKYPGQVIETPFSLVEAVSARNSCAKTIYGKLFDWIVARINSTIDSRM